MDNIFTNEDELLIAYIDGEIDAVSLSVVENRLSAESSLKAKLNSLLLAKEAVQQYGLKLQVGAIHKQMMKEQVQAPVRNLPPTRKMYRIVAAIAAAVLLFVAGYWFMQGQPENADKVFVANYMSYELPITRSESTETDVEKAYRNKDFRLVLNTVEKNKLSSPVVNFLTGMASMELGKIDNAITYFNKVIENNKSASSVYYNDESQYYLALAYIKNGNYEMAWKLLDIIRSDKQHIYNYKVTDKLLAQLKKLMKN